MKKSKNYFGKAAALVMVMIMIAATVSVGITAYADNPDPTSTLQTAFTTLGSSEMVFIEYTLTGEGELLANEKVELDNAHNVKLIKAKDIDSGSWNTLYTNLAEKITYYQDGDQWYKYPTDEEELVGLGKTLTDNGIETSIVTGATYVYDSESKISVVNSYTGASSDFDCYIFRAEIPVVITDDDDETDEDSDDEDDDADDPDDPDEEQDTDIVTVYYYITKDTGIFVHAETREGMIVGVDIAYPSADDPATALEIPQEAIDNAILEDGYEMPANSKGDVRYKVAYKGKKGYLIVLKAASKKKITVPKTYKILGKAYPVWEIGSSAFAGNKKLQTVTIKADITKIGSKAFYNAKKLKTVTIKSKKLKTIGKNSFDTNSKKLNVKLSGSKKYKTKISKLITKSRAGKAKKKTKLTVK